MSKPTRTKSAANRRRKPRDAKPAPSTCNAHVEAAPPVAPPAPPMPTDPPIDSPNRAPRDKDTSKAQLPGLICAFIALLLISTSLAAGIGLSLLATRALQSNWPLAIGSALTIIGAALAFAEHIQQAQSWVYARLVTEFQSHKAEER